MPYQDLKRLTARGQIQLRFAKRASKLVGVYQCLIVSADANRRETFERAAADAGWKTFLCADASTALAMVNRSYVQLAIVDFEGRQGETFRPIVEQFKLAGGLLLIVCGNEGDVEEEIWARQLGAWLYLPGVVDDSNLSLLCGEARQLVARLAEAKTIERGGLPTAENVSRSKREQILETPDGASSQSRDTHEHAQQLQPGAGFRVSGI